MISVYVMCVIDYYDFTLNYIPSLVYLTLFLGYEYTDRSCEHLSGNVILIILFMFFITLSANILASSQERLEEYMTIFFNPIFTDKPSIILQ